MAKQAFIGLGGLRHRKDGKGHGSGGQEYVDPLLVLPGEEYATMPFQTLLKSWKKSSQWPTGGCRVS